jgi:aspartyl-tRNA(Asn)/glutamyl-tRNA(Gln) amidotransferase subunit A
MSDEFAYMSASRLRDGFETGAFLPSDVTAAALARIDRLNPALNAFQVIDADAAADAAASADGRWRAGAPLGRLDGLPMTIKDTVDAAGWPTRSGSRTTPETPAAADAPVVARLREAGAVILGKTTTPEFGWKGMTNSPLAGITRNPWNTAHTPGGSSGGAAAALAAGIGVMAHGTDGGGSVRIPASYCGLYGLKPTFGRVPHHPQTSPFATLISSGPLARSMADLAALLMVMIRPDARDWYALPTDPTDYEAIVAEPQSSLAGMKIAVSYDLGGAEIQSDIRGAVAAAAAVLADLGAEVEEVGPIIAPLRERFERYWLAGFAHRMRSIPEADRALMDPGLRALAEEGLKLGLSDYYAGAEARAALGSDLNLFHQRYDLLLTPTMPTTPPPVETVYHSADFDRFDKAVPFTLPFNLTGQPAASVPCGLCDKGLPIGLQIVGPRFAEATILKAAAAFEQAVPAPSYGGILP